MIRLLSLAILVAGLLHASPAAAHKVNVFAYAEGGTVYTESYFNDGTPCRNSHIVVYGENGAVVAEGTTDAEGQFSFPIGRPQDLRIVLEASMGHKNGVRLSAAEIGGEGSAEEPGPSPEASEEAGSEAGAPLMDTAALEEVLDRVLAKRLKPLRETLVRMEQAQEKPSLPTVLGGIGFIVGMAGMYLWGRSGRR